jgi:hypothetical protein
MTKAMNADALALLERLCIAVERLADRRPAPDARAALLLRSIWSAVGPEQFTAARVVELAQGRHRTALQAAVAGASAKAIGKRLSLLVGETIDGLRLDRSGTGRPAVYRLFDCDRGESRIGNPWRV